MKWWDRIRGRMKAKEAPAQDVSPTGLPTLAHLESMTVDELNELNQAFARDQELVREQRRVIARVIDAKLTAARKG